MKNKLLFLLITLLCLYPKYTKAAIETSEYVTIEVGKNYKLELPDPSRGYIDQTRWANNTNKIRFVSSTQNDEALVWIVADKYFEGEATVECLYTCAFHDDNIGGTRADTYLRTYYIKCKQPEKKQLNLTITPYGGAVKAGSTVEIKATASGKAINDATIYYTLDKTEPTQASNLYTGPITINHSLTLKAIAYHNDYATSNVKSAKFTVGEHYDGEVIHVKTIEGVEMALMYTVSSSSTTLSVCSGEGTTPAIDKKYSGKITIPREIEGIPITAVGKDAFNSCDGLISVVIPNSVATIGLRSFYLCSKLTELTIPSSVKTIAKDAFNSCGLRSVIIPEGLTNIGESAFRSNKSLTIVSIPSTIYNRGIGEDAFGFCDNLETIYCYATTPPEINENVFNLGYPNIRYNESATLFVSKGCSSKYKSATGWKRFNTIKEIGEESKPKLTLIANPSSGSVESGTKVYLTASADDSSISNADIYYTTNGSTPSKSSTKYTTSGITINSATTIKGIAYKDGYEASEVGSWSYTIATKSKLMLSANPSGGSVEPGSKVYLTAKADGSAISGTDIYYTTNGATPSKSNTKYTPSGITINSVTTLKAIAYKDGYETSDVGSWNYTISAIKPTAISVSPSSKTIKVGGTFNPTYSLTPTNATTTVTWTSDDSSIASVNSSTGLVTGKKVGSTYINATTANGKKGWCKVTVESDVVKVTSISITGNSSTPMEIGSTRQLSATIYPSNATNKSVTWSSSNTSVATVSSSGRVTAKAAGAATITCKANDGSGVKATCSVTVKSVKIYATGISLNTSTAILGIGDTKQLSATIYPSDATDKSVSWTSETVVWEGDKIVDNWGNQPYMLSDGGTELVEAGMKIGSVIRFYITPIEDEWQCQIWEGHWGTIYGDTYGDFSSSTWNLSEHYEAMELSVTEAIYNDLATAQYWGGSFVLNGDNVRCTKITIDNPNIATVSSSGEVKGIKAGKALIRAKTSNNLYATCDVIVKSTQWSGTGTKDAPFNSIAANEFASSLVADTPTDQDYYAKGKVVSIKEQFSTQYGNATFYISDDGTSANQFYIFRAKYLRNKKYAGEDLVLNVGDEVVVCGKFVNYKGNLPETVQNEAYVVSINGETTGVVDVMMDNREDAPIYNLRGQRLTTPQKGINIIDGKKAVIK